MMERCPGCGAESQAIPGPIHKYMTSTPACWNQYGQLLNTLYQRPALRGALVMAVDSYAAQHPGSHDPRAIQSVAVHLVNLYAYIVGKRPVDFPQATISDGAFDAIAPASHRESFWLAPPTFAEALTVFDMPVEGTDDLIAQRARAWAESTWQAWQAHHARVAEWYAALAR